MNETECEDLIKSVKWTEPANLISLAILEFINVLVIGGNCLVIAAVFCSNKLRSVTNFFIVNLAVADLLVGLAVLPFSATWEVFKVWIFGDVWCRIWLAVDVWMCTASILNLCAISLDRYVAVTRPVTYPSIMSTKKAKSLIAGIWVLSFVICFPPLVGWKDQKAVEQATYSRGNYTLFYATTMSSTEDGQLELDSIKEQGGEPESSAHISKGNAYNPYDPDFAPIDGSAEIRIAAMATSSSSSSSSTTSSPSQSSTEMEYDLLNAPPQNRAQTTPGSCPWKCELTNDRGYVLYSALGSFYIPMFVMLFFYWRIYRAAVRTTRAINQGFKTTKGSKGIGSRFEEQRLTLRIHRGRGSNQHDSMHSNGSTQSTTTTLGTPSPERLSKYATRRLHQHHDKIKISVSYPSTENIHELTHGDSGRDRRPSGNALFAVHYNGASGREATESQLYRQQHGGGSSCYLQVGKALPELCRRQSNTSESGGGSGHSRPANKKMGRRNIKAQVKRFRMETKAAKTLAIIVGMFIFCWCPFFTMYIIRPFCQDCVDPLLFSVLFWLGYCNSAVNPMIYALFSKDFRFAFKRIICRCFCSRQSVSLKSSRRGSDMSAIRIRARTPSITPSAAAHSFGDESELHHSEMSNDPR
ncbi:octopamine receptor Oamb isoform X2 [Drosophila guanche]|uniref:Blast:Probable G-protein coupled receptor No9 n=1 Tax=Drosophila guanche TaxID=7266 RepID=A0A3B0JLB2_DROGU|nr:octopamine receptor Oamb isoform X2 [Drosophila guanche]SPP83104.1 blast:Probable G-protein coupled receptor No9 [Drosophila guanche]